MVSKIIQPVFSLKWYHKFLINVLKAGPIPQHIAIIMDGNRRYAKSKNVASSVGHSRGIQKLGDVLHWCEMFGIREMTVYAFSIENFKRDPQEVDNLMSLVNAEVEELLDNENRFHLRRRCIRFIGNMKLIAEELRAKIARLMLLTKDHSDFVLNIAFAYTCRDEITDAFQHISHGVRSKDISVDDITENLISKCMYSGKSNKVDIFIRTSGEVKFSDFFMWQSYNANILFESVLWPSFSIWHILACIFKYQMFYNDQKEVEKVLGNGKQVENNAIEAFLKNVEEKRITELLQQL